jgi:hypothetical protein
LVRALIRPHNGTLAKNRLRQAVGLVADRFSISNAAAAQAGDRNLLSRCHPDLARSPNRKPKPQATPDKPKPPQHQKKFMTAWSSLGIVLLVALSALVFIILKGRQ